MLMNECRDYTGESIAQDLRALGLRAGDKVNVHSSMKQMSGGASIRGGPATVIEALLQVIGPSGTLLMPVFSLPADDIDLRHTVSRLGIISETFRQWPGVLRSSDPTHSVAALGADAATLIEGHESVPPLGVASPLHKLACAGGKILMLGTTLTSCSLLHVAESLAKVPYLHIAYPGYKRSFSYRDQAGCLQCKPFSEGPGDGNGFAKLDKNPALQATRIGAAPVAAAASYLFEALPLLNLAVACIEADQAALLCDNPNCAVCPARKRVVTQSV